MEDEKPHDHKMHAGKEAKPPLEKYTTKTSKSEQEPEKPVSNIIPPAADAMSEFAQGYRDGEQGKMQRRDSLKYKAGHEAGRAKREGKT